MNFHERSIYNSCQCELIDKLDCGKCIKQTKLRERVKIASRIMLFIICIFSGIICFCAIYSVLCRDSCSLYKGYGFGYGNADSDLYFNTKKYRNEMYTDFPFNSMRGSKEWSDVERSVGNIREDK